MAKPNPNPPQVEPQTKQPGRVRSAFRVLRGEAVVPSQIEWEWREYQVRFNSLLDKFSALLARDAKRQARIEGEEEPTSTNPATLQERARLKAELGSKLTGLRAS